MGDWGGGEFSVIRFCKQRRQWNLSLFIGFNKTVNFSSFYFFNNVHEIKKLRNRLG